MEEEGGRLPLKNGVSYPFSLKIFVARLGNIFEMKRFDIRKIRRLGARERYGELYFHWREAEQMIASNFPDAKRYGRRLKKRVERLYAQWFGPFGEHLHQRRPRLL